MIAVLTSLLAMGPLQARDPAELLRQPANATLNLKTYTLKLQGCPISFHSLPDGFVALQSTDPKAGYFSREGFEHNFDLSLNLQCVDRPAAEVCPTTALQQGNLDAQTGS
ncbi:MAG: hypothetical protein ABI143_12720 [Caldimonas sp.]